MKRKIACIFMVCVLLAGCAGAPTQTGEEAVAFTDALGRKVKVDSPKRVAALLGSFAQIWMLAGGEVCATAEDAWLDLNLELPEEAVNLGAMRELSLELLLASSPELILASTSTRQHIEWKETLEGTKTPLAYFNVSNFEDYLSMLEICTRLTGRADLYEQNGLKVREQIEAVRAKSAERGTHPTVLCLRASASLIAVKNSQNNVMGEILKDLGCVNIADTENSLLENISIERILEANPEYIFIVQRGDDPEGTRKNIESLMASSPAWQQLSAVKEGRVYYMEKELYNMKPNHRWGEAYEKMEEILRNG